jgi:CheY-like chemotaxis protein
MAMPLILLIDDDSEFAYLIDRYGAESGCQIEHVTTVDEALNLLRIHPSDAFLLNLLLPSEDSWRFLQLIKKDGILKNIPGIVFSAIRDEERAMTAGANFCLWKPIMFSDFVAALTAVGLKHQINPGNENKDPINAAKRRSYDHPSA